MDKKKKEAASLERYILRTIDQPHSTSLVYQSASTMLVGSIAYVLTHIAVLTQVFNKIELQRHTGEQVQSLSPLCPTSIINRLAQPNKSVFCGANTTHLCVAYAHRKYRIHRAHSSNRLQSSSTTGLKESRVFYSPYVRRG